MRLRQRDDRGLRITAAALADLHGLKELRQLQRAHAEDPEVYTLALQLRRQRAEDAVIAKAWLRRRCRVPKCHEPPYTRDGICYEHGLGLEPLGYER